MDEKESAVMLLIFPISRRLQQFSRQAAFATNEPGMYTSPVRFRLVQTGPRARLDKSHPFGETNFRLGFGSPMVIISLEILNECH